MNIVIPSNIILKKINIKYNNNQESYADTWATDIGSNIFLYMHNRESESGGLIIDQDYIINMKIYNDSFLPTLELTFRDPLSIIGNKLYPDDNTIISFFKKSGIKEIMPVRMDFYINQFRMVKDKSNSDDKIYSLIAYISFNNISENASYKGTSFNVLRLLSQKLDLGFVSNINNTNDEMTWINPGDYMTSFIPEITKYSYIDDSSFLISFIDLYYNLNFINIEKQLSENTFNQLNLFSLEDILKNDIDYKKSLSLLLLTNHPNMIGSNLFIDKYIIDNKAKDVNWSIGYETQIFYYDKIENSSEIKKLNTLTDNINPNKIVFKSLDPNENFRKINIGKQDQDNVHNNYLLSKIHNDNNIDFLQVISMNIILQSFNMTIYRMQPVEIIIYDLNTMINQMGTDTDKTDSYRINEKLTGSWLITGINYVYKKNNFYQEITLVRRDINIDYDKEKLDEITRKFYEYKKN